MSAVDDPIADSEQARLALRGLADAIRNVGFPADARPVIGSLLDGLRSLWQVLDQLATVHTTNVRSAFGEDGDHRTGLTEVHVTASALHRAAREIGRTQLAVEVAYQHSGLIVWSDRASAMVDSERRSDLQVAERRRDGCGDVAGVEL
jgi:hypothetical protein